MKTIYHPEHPHYAINKAYIEGCFAEPDKLPVVQFMGKDGQWMTDEMINGRREKFWEGVTYRIKPPHCHKDGDIP